MGNYTQKNIEHKNVLYHFTKIKHLDSIIKYGLLSRKDLITHKIIFDDVAEKGIITFRQEHDMDKFIPYHFFGNTPFEGRVRQMFPDDDFMYIAIQRDLAKNLKAKIVPRHPINMEEFMLYDYENGLSAIQWDIMNKRIYKNYDCREICMAECLIESPININQFISLTVKNENNKMMIKQKLDLENIRGVHINVQPEWFNNA